MGLFEKKYCDICGNKIGLLGNRKLVDANMCGDCNKKLSTWFSDRKESTLEQIKSQLAYREANAVMLADFHPTEEIGLSGDKFLKIDRRMGRFVLLRGGEDMKKNPDLLELDRVRDVHMEVKEDRSEVRYKDAEGRSRSYEPKHYSYRYHFKMTIDYDGEFFDELRFDLNSTSINGGTDGEHYRGQYSGPSIMKNAAHQILGGIGLENSSLVQGHITRTGSFSNHDDLPGGYRLDGYTTMKEADIRRYRECESAGEKIIAALLKKARTAQESMDKLMEEAHEAMRFARQLEAASPAPMAGQTFMASAVPMAGQNAMASQDAPARTVWSCPACGNTQNTGKFCMDCGAPRP